ncbi:uncharacterized protein LOC111612678 [Centruroides sculpturatus]|uniref:uncharacterized protein LOC111612678 n=1 Tax=Centruroides sculpturatus TaxID=218467 RepID=UPI000C6E0105|nr:uncharacterized protein LOC111612678 [Centruroides sculpturatus]
MSSLQYVCLIYIRDNLNAIKEYFRNKNISERSLFERLPPILCEFMINMCSWTFDRSTFSCLFRNGIKEISISSHNQPLPIENKEKVFSKIVCMRLTFTTIESEHLYKLMSYLTGVVILNLRRTQTNDEVLEVIGKTCLLLEKLDVSSCPISDKGIISLCHGSSNIQKIRCQNLKVLDVHRTAVTSEGLAYVLKYLPLLTVFAEKNVQLNMIYTFVRFNFDKKLKIRNVCLSPAPYTFDILEVLLAVPNITSLCLYKISISDADFISLPKFKSLQSLSLSVNKHDRMLTFEGVIGFLLISGKNLKILKLNNFEYVNLFLIGCLCKELQCLYLYSIRHLYFRKDKLEDQQTVLFKNLEFMQIENLRGNAWEGCYSSYFTHCPMLKILTLVSVTNTDVIQIAPFLERVECIILLFVDDITTCSIFYIIENQFYLRNLFIFTRENVINERDIQQITNYIRDNNIPLKFAYWPGENMNLAESEDVYSVNLDEMLIH